ncbi:glycerophosphoryl diester phosphodiesterase [Evansella caseinilytica]|uniref:Glycerophosphoryl diester phosphodiesterase n=1 Tax=Evansella caseinilytica TaxID=1503961 RepID=A0A1H3RWR4_9BACI|nr:glycerophosphodiester phosphodiesterase [Evansella caseinilytica]SDZ30163.1 glycerophosphoryl diester phosphodiesterase [Evansella caseinilytica]
MRVSVVNLTQRPKKKKALRKLAILTGVILVVWGMVYLLPVPQRPDHPFFDNERPLVIAHQGGEHLAPSNTLAAFEQARELGADVLEFDVHMTKDGHLVAIHDATVDRTTDGNGRVNELTLAEIKSLDAGYSFQDLHGEYSYRGAGITIPAVEEIFAEFNEMKMVIELKATNDPKLYQPMIEKFWELIETYRMHERVLIASFDQEMIDSYMQVSEGKTAVSGGREEIRKFVIYHKLFLNGLYRPSVDAIQIPTEEGRFNLKDKKLLRGAKRLGMDVHYWTINDKETMRELLKLGADGIVTDRPDLLLEVLNEEGY